MKALSIMYHDVVEAGRFESSGFPGEGAHIYKLDREEFRRHLAAISGAAGPHVSAIESATNFNGQPVFLTFDDGGASAHACIADMLEGFGWRGHFFVTTGRIGSAGFVNESQIRDLRRRGHVIGSHSRSHPTRMSHVPYDQMREEWAASVERLAEILGEPVKTASVPGGFYSRKVAEAAALAGIEVLFTSEPTAQPQRVNQCLVLGRYAIMRGMEPAVSGAFAEGRLIPRCKQALVWKAKKAAKSLGGEAYLRLRQLLLSKRANG